MLDSCFPADHSFGWQLCWICLVIQITITTVQVLCPPINYAHIPCLLSLNVQMNVSWCSFSCMDWFIDKPLLSCPMPFCWTTTQLLSVTEKNIHIGHCQKVLISIIILCPSCWCCRKMLNMKHCFRVSLHKYSMKTLFHCWTKFIA